MSEWISVKERLPEPKKLVLVYCENNGIMVDSYVESFGNFLGACGLGLKITHWTTLPEPPKED